MNERYRGFWRVAGLAGLAVALCAGSDGGRDTPVADGPLPVVALAVGVPEMTVPGATSWLAGGYGWMVPYIGYEPVVEVEPPSAPSYGGGVVVAAEHMESSWPAQLSRDDLERVYDLAGVPVEWRESLARIAWCESKWSPGAVGDAGNSLGLHQMWFGWARDGEDLMDPVVNARVAVRVREGRGRFGGGGGWTCADLEGIE